MSALLALAVAAPVVGAAWSRLAPSAALARRALVTGALILAGVWVVLLVTDAEATLGRVGTGAAPAAAGTWLLASTISWPTRRLPIALASLVAGTAVLGLSLGGGGDLSDVAGALAVAAALAAVAARSEDDDGLLAACASVIGASLIAAGLVRLESTTGGFESGGGLPVVAGAALIALGATWRARRVGVLLLPIGLALGIQAGAALDGGDGAALVLAAAATVAAWRGPLGAPLALWALAASCVGATPGALLLAAAAVVVASTLHPLFAVSALPGAASLAMAVVDDGAPARLALIALAAATVAGLWRLPIDVMGGRPAPPTIAALVTAAWLTLAPETWGWVGSSQLGTWGTGVVVAAVAGLVGTYLAMSLTDAHVVVPGLEVPDPVGDRHEPTWAWRAALVSLVVLGICSAALVASVLD